MDVNAICDVVAVLIEPDPELRDDARARPAKAYEIETLYVWPVGETLEAVDTGQQDEERFVLRVAWAADRVREVEDLDRGVSDRIVEHAERLKATVRANRAVADAFEWLHVDAIDYESLRGHDVRGYIAGVTGYRLRTD